MSLVASKLNELTERVFLGSSPVVFQAWPSESVRGSSFRSTLVVFYSDRCPGELGGESFSGPYIAYIQSPEK